jgi:DNA-binding CsgD family transcriptional regulator
MALTSGDENDLLLPLMQGSGERSPFATFLQRLRRRAAAASSGLVIRSGDSRRSLDLFSGVQFRRANDDRDRHGTAPYSYDHLRLGRVYGVDEFDDHDPVRKRRRIRDMRQLGLLDERIVRLLDEPGLSAWLIVAKDRPCSAADSALLSALAPYVAVAVRGFLTGERQRLADAMNARSLHHAGAGWIVFDKAACVLAIAPDTAGVLSGLFGHPPTIGQRLRELGPATDRALGDAAAAFALAEDAPERTMVLSTTPSLQAILSPLSGGDAGLLDGPVMLATCRQARAPASTRAAHFANLYDLPRREAELAILLADGLSLSHVGQAMGLTIETTRNYSKRLYAKVGVRGQAELVRAVYESCALLA